MAGGIPGIPAPHAGGSAPVGAGNPASIDPLSIDPLPERPTRPRRAARGFDRLRQAMAQVDRIEDDEPDADPFSIPAEPGDTDPVQPAEPRPPTVDSLLEEELEALISIRPPGERKLPVDAPPGPHKETAPDDPSGRVEEACGEVIAAARGSDIASRFSEARNGARFTLQSLRGERPASASSTAPRHRTVHRQRASTSPLAIAAWLCLPAIVLGGVYVAATSGSAEEEGRVLAAATGPAPSISALPSGSGETAAAAPAAKPDSQPVARPVIPTGRVIAASMTPAGIEERLTSAFDGWPDSFSPPAPGAASGSGSGNAPNELAFAPAAENRSAKPDKDPARLASPGISPAAPLTDLPTGPETAVRDATTARVPAAGEAAQQERPVPAGPGSKSRDPSRVATAIEAVPALAELTEARRGELQARLEGGDCLSAALPAVLGKVPVLAMRDMIRLLEGDCL